MGQLGMTTWVDPVYKIYDFIAAAAQMGFSYIEIKTDYPLTTLIPNEKFRIRIKQLLETFKVKPIVHAPYYDVNISSLNSKVRKASIESVIDSIKFAHDIGAKIVTLHPGNLPSDYSPSYYLENACAALKDSLFEIIKVASEYSVIIGLENKQKSKNHQIIWTPEDHLYFVEGLSSKWLKITYDVGHAFTVGNDVVSYFKKTHMYIVNLHIHDNHGESDEHLVPGSGNINFHELVDVLKKYNYGGPIILEVKSISGLQRAKVFMNSLGIF
ncbi:MAG: sugar phosphate isomerase/epimerase family protein [Candidatus Asgardarchaeum sp.]